MERNHMTHEDQKAAVTDRASGKWTFFWIAAIATFMGTLDSSIVNIALPTLEREFQADVNTVAWVVQSYLLVSMVFLLIGGRLLDVWSVRAVLGLGFSLFTLGSALCAGSWSIYVLILSRAVQGLGAAILMSANQGLIVRVFPEHQRGRTLGMIGTVVSVGLATGPPLGGFLIETLGWRYAYAASGLLILVPLIPVVLLMRNRPEELGLFPDGRDSPPSAIVTSNRPSSSASRTRSGVSPPGAVGRKVTAAPRARRRS